MSTNIAEKALADEAITALHDFLGGGVGRATTFEDLDAVYRARRAINILWEYLHYENLPATYDEDGEVLNHGRCVD